jgi:uncharacterized membrane protein YphA (DoxX/SURF4 family)
MKIAMIIVSSLLTLLAVASASVKLRKSPQVVQDMTHVGVRENQIPLLALVEIAGGVGLLVGFATKDLGRLAAAGLVLYFAGAIVAHLRIKDNFKTLAPALFLFFVSVGTLVLQIQR